MSDVKKKLEEILAKMRDINYGIVDKNGEVHTDDNDWEFTFASLYILQSPEQLLASHYGVCWDQVELERYYLEEAGLDFDTYYMIANDGQACPTHTFVVVRDGDKVYLLEHAWGQYQGVYEFTSIDGLLKDVQDKFVPTVEAEHFELSIYTYSKPQYGISCEEFMAHCANPRYKIS